MILRREDRGAAGARPPDSKTARVSHHRVCFAGLGNEIIARPAVAVLPSVPRLRLPRERSRQGGMVNFKS